MYRSRPSKKGYVARSAVGPWEQAQDIVVGGWMFQVAVDAIVAR